MPVISSHAVKKAIEEVYRKERARVFATLVRIFSSFDVAEEVLHEAFAIALEQWAEEGIPKNPAAWLVSVGRFKAIDAIRKRSRFEKFVPELVSRFNYEANEDIEWNESQFKDDQLRLIFTCCHPALASSTQVALTLREICGLTTDEIAAAFLTTGPTIAQRIVRGKSKIRDAKIPYKIPEPEELHERLESVLAVVYLVFNEGYSASSGTDLTRPLLSNEAIRLGRHLLNILPDPDVIGLLALMLLHDSRRTARVTESGDLILLEDQDRTLWDQELIAEGIQLVNRVMVTGHFSLYAMQAAISAIHAQASSAAETNWSQIVSIYDHIFEYTESPVVELNRAVAVAMRDSPEAGIALIDVILQRGDLNQYHLIYAAHADLYRRLGKNAEAKASYEIALTLVKQEPERRFLEKRLSEMN